MLICNTEPKNQDPKKTKLRIADETQNETAFDEKCGSENPEN